MSLLEEYMESCTILDKTHGPDGYGGIAVVWVDGVSINAAITLDSSMEARLAEKQGVTAVYTITTTRAVNLQYHDVVRRESDKKIFRVTSDGDDKKTPNSAGLNMRVVSAEEWELPKNE